MMARILVAVSGLFIISTSQAQSISERKACYEQARRYLVDIRKDTGTAFEYMSSHYNPHTKACLIEYQSFEGQDRLGTVSRIVADAFGGGEIAWFLGAFGKPPAMCEVNGKPCSSETQFTGMVKSLFEDPCPCGDKLSSSAEHKK